MSRFLRITAEICIVIILLFGIAVGVVRLFFPQIDRYKPYFEQWASAALHQTVKIEKITTSWCGLHPEIDMESVKILDNKGQSHLQIPRLRLGLKIIPSLLQHRLILSSIAVSNTHLQVRRINSNLLAINGILIPLKMNATKKTDIGSVGDWLFRQGQISLENMDIDWQDENSQTLHMTHFSAVLKNGLLKSQIMGVARLLGRESTRFRFVIHLTQVNGLHAECYFYLRDFDVASWVAQKYFSSFYFSQGSLDDLQLWAIWENGNWQQAQTIFHLKQAILESRQYLQAPVHIDELSGNFVWHRENQGSIFAADKIKLVLNQQAWPLTQFSVKQKIQTDKTPFIQIFQADSLDLAQLRTFTLNTFAMPDSLKLALENLMPQAHLKNFLLRQETVPIPAKNACKSFLLKTRFTDLKTSAWKNMPAIVGLNGMLAMTSTTGDLQLAGDQMTLDIPVWFTHSFSFKNYKGHLQWKKEVDVLKIQAKDIALTDANMAMRARFSLFLPQAGDTPYLQFLAAFSEQDASHLKDYLPEKALSSHPSLATWLREAFIAGDGVDGQLLFQGPLSHFPFDDNTGTFKAFVHVKNMTFDYKTGWPEIFNLNADADFHNRELTIQASNGVIMNTNTGPITARIEDLANAELIVSGNVKTTMQNGLRFISESPLKKTVGEGLENLTLNGEADLGLRLHIPLHTAASQTEVEGNVAVLPGASLDAFSGYVHLTDLIGVFKFTENGLFADQLRACWLGQPVAIAIDTKSEMRDGHAIFVSAHGKMSIANLQKTYGLNFLQNKIVGETNYQALLKIIHQAGHPSVDFTVDSDLQGIKIDLPEPLKKAANEKYTIHTQVKFSNKSDLNIFAQYAKKLSAAMTFSQNQKKDWIFQQGNIRFGDVLAELQTNKGLLIDGNLSKLTWTEVADYLNPFLKAKEGGNINTNFQLRELNLTVDQLNALGITLSSATVLAKMQPQSWSVKINSPTVTGELTIPKGLDSPIIGNFERFRFQTGVSSVVSGINPGDIPPLDLQFKNFYYGNKFLDQVSLLTSSGDNLLQIRQLNIRTGDTYLTSTGRWQQVDKDHQQTTISGNVDSRNIGAALKTWQVTSSVLGGNGKMAFALSWPSAAYDFSSKQLDGSFSLAFAKGSIIDIGRSKEAEMGIGRILNLLSLQSIPKRLSLDFSDLLEKGFVFDQMKGDFSMQNGNAVTENGSLRGSVAKIEIKGKIGVSDKNYNLDMRITPYVTGSLPVAAAIVGGPVIGAATWLGDKVLGSVVNHIVAQTYQITGSWDNPLVQKKVQ